MATSERAVRKSSRERKYTEKGAAWIQDQRRRSCDNINILPHNAQSFNVDDLKLGDSASMISRRSRSIRSSNSVTSRAEVLRLEEEQRRAELNARRAAVDRQFEFEMTKLEMKRQEEKLNLQTEMEVSQARLNVLDKFNDDNDDVDDAIGTYSIRPENIRSSTSNAHLDVVKDHKVSPLHHIPITPILQQQTGAPAYISTQVPPIRNPVDSHDQMANAQHPSHNRPEAERTYHNSSIHRTGIDPSTDNDLSSAISTLASVLSLQDNHLPKKEPDVFSGTVFDFPFWVNSFSVLVENKYPAISDRIYYLGKYTSGRAKECIKGLLCLGTEAAYIKAKKLLTDRYGNKLLLANTYREKFDNWPVIKNGDHRGFQELADFLTQCEAAMATLGQFRVLDDPSEYRKILAKIPRYAQVKWLNVVDTWIYNPVNGTDEDCITAQHDGYPPFSKFCCFITKEARIACNPLTIKVLETPNETQRFTKSTKKDTARSFASRSEAEGYNDANPPITTSGKTERAREKPMCLLCTEDHTLDACKNFKSMTLPARVDYVKKRRLCWGCLKWGHRKQECRHKMQCDICQRYHPALLHDDKFTSSQTTTPSRPVSTNDTPTTAISRCIDMPSSNCSHSLIVPVILHHRQCPQKTTRVYALLDDQSDACFMTESVLEQLDIDGEETELELSTIMGKETVGCKRVTGLVVKGFKEDKEINLPVTYTRATIPAQQSQIPKRETVERWPHLKKVAEQLNPYSKDMEIGLLIGLTSARAIRPTEVVPGKDDDPYGIHTALGWGVIGMINDGVPKNCARRFVATPDKEKNCHFACKTHVKEIPPDEVSKMFELEFNEQTKGEPYEKLSMQDKVFMKKMKDGIHVNENGHYEMPLPFKNEQVHLPNNKEMALKRLNGLRARMNKQPKFKEDYSTFMTDMIAKGHAEKVPIDELSIDGTVWYIPHHGVYHARKPDRIRVVFDCSAEYKDTVLNKQLLQGPDMTNNLTGVLCRFRKEHIAFTCDIEGMFFQVGVDERDRNYLRFLRWENGQLEKPLTEYRMTTHLFGATSSPGCANYALKTAADAYRKTYGDAAADFMKNDFYVDDGLKSVATEMDAIKLIETTNKICQTAGFNLHKYVSNSTEVLSAIPVSKRAKNVQNIDIFCDELPLEQALGVQWCVESDTLQFRVILKTKPITRRGILSTISSIFDPLGLVSPFLLKGKQILQRLCNDKCGWDDPVPEDVKMQWEKWRFDLQCLSQLNVPRCYKPKDFGPVQRAEMHHFSDAYMEGYGQCTYLRLTDTSGDITSTLVMAKSRVTPSRPITIPRLELTAAVTSVAVASFLDKELDYDEISHFYYTDSRVVLGYIANDSKRFHIFVANRVQKIRDASSPSGWKYVNTKDNPADIASRGIDANDLINCTIWWKGPPSLSTTELLPDTSGMIEVSPADPEVKRAAVFSTHNVSPTFETMEERFERFSTWFRLKRAVALCIRLKDRMRHHQILKQPRNRADQANKDRRKSYAPVSVAEMQAAEREILKHVQKHAFPAEMDILSKAAKGDSSSKDKVPTLSKYSSVISLDPFVDVDMLLRVGGRIKQANIPKGYKHPVLLPRKGHVTNLLIDHYHRLVGHAGRGITLNEIRQAGYWIVRARQAVTQHIMKCVSCRKLRGSPCEQMMSDLPTDRLDPAPPFSFSAVDYFGPFMIKEGRKEVTRWGVLFTCMASRAIHIETSHAMTTDSFLNAYRRFVCRRGPVRQLRCDRGTNFIGGKNELTKALTELDSSKISRELSKDNCDWISFNMNFPHSSHMGGSWERLIRSVRNALSSILQKNGQQLDDELFRTFTSEAEAIVNSRPLTYVDTVSPDSPVHISPMQLLTLKSKVLLPPPGIFQREDMYCHRRWRRVQYLANQFWSQWRAEYTYRYSSEGINGTRNAETFTSVT